MYINEDKVNSPYMITAYDDQSVTVGNQVLKKNFALAPPNLITELEPQSFKELQLDHFKFLLTSPCLLLIGTGKKTIQLTEWFRYSLESQNIHVECMNTAAACRTYTALLTEGRNIAGLFFLE